MRARRSRRFQAGGRPPNRCRLAVALTMFLSCFLGVGALSTASASAQEPNYVIATDATSAPFEFHYAGGGLVGVDMDLIRAIAKDQG